MKKFIKTFILAICLIVPSMFCLTACGDHTHTFGEWMISIEATCAADGQRYRECAVCGYQEAETITKTGHVFGEVIIDETPTTQSAGGYHRECKSCHTIDQGVVSAIKSTGLEFELNEDQKSYALTGVGSCSDTYINVPNTYQGLPVTTIANRAFRLKTNITGVTLSENTKRIEEDAFGYCDIKSITIPTSVEFIHQNSFRDDVDITRDLYYQGTVADWIKTMGQSTVGIMAVSYNLYFNGELATEITIPATVNDIPSGAFRSCKSIKKVNIENGVKNIGDNCFCSSNIEEVTLPDSIETIGIYAFGFSNIREIIIPQKTLTTGCSILDSCSSLKKVIIKSKTIELARDLFYQCYSLTEIQFYGTIFEWQELKKDGDWDAGTNEYTIYCTDGTIAKDGTIDKN